MDFSGPLHDCLLPVQTEGNHRTEHHRSCSVRFTGFKKQSLCVGDKTLPQPFLAKQGCLNLCSSHPAV